MAVARCCPAGIALRDGAWFRPLSDPGRDEPGLLSEPGAHRNAACWLEDDQEASVDRWGSRSNQRTFLAASPTPRADPAISRTPSQYPRTGRFNIRSAGCAGRD